MPSYSTGKQVVRKVHQFKGDVIETDLHVYEPGFNYATNTNPTCMNFFMANANQTCGPYDPTVSDCKSYQVFHVTPFLKRPDVSGTQILEFKDAGFGGGTLHTTPLSVVFPNLKTLCLRYQNYRPMRCKVTLVVRPNELQYPGPDYTTPTVPVVPFPYTMYAIVWNHSENHTTYGGYWNGRNAITQNGVNSSIFFRDLPNMKFARALRVRGFGSSNGSQGTMSVSIAPWKVLGLSRIQWLTDKDAMYTCDGLNPNKHDIRLAFTCTDNDTLRRNQYNLDFSYSLTVRWEGHKFLTEAQA